jgi:metal-responsive CopG/Arc/MetJ family transcriptional regulator
MELNVETDEDLLDAIDRAARFQGITRDEAIKEALTAWVAQARRNAVIQELFEVEFDSDLARSRSTASETLSASPAVEVE